MNRRTVLVVEEHSGQRATLGRVLRAEGHTVLEAASAEAGLALLSAPTGDATATPVSLVVVGEGPLGRTGARMLRGMSRASAPATPAVVLTACGPRGSDADLTFGLQKPFQVEELLALVSDFAQRRRPD
ncbi:MAG: hypothetical protein R3B40_17370 [Polyangiales bacterium]|nr:response regulator transcription factor [Myxococcales bacterium]MCB9661266.1 response regulator transcription factor [Sandaracinaceae bacterium]